MRFDRSEDSYICNWSITAGLPRPGTTHLRSHTGPRQHVSMFLGDAQCRVFKSNMAPWRTSVLCLVSVLTDGGCYVFYSSHVLVTKLLITHARRHTTLLAVVCVCHVPRLTIGNKLVPGIRLGQLFEICFDISGSYFPNLGRLGIMLNTL